MGILQPSSSRRRDAGRGVLGIIERSIGYLQGGYYTGGVPGTRNDGSEYPPPGQERGAYSSWQSVQLFNCITQVGNIIYNTGFPRRYYAGVSGNTAGYYSTNDLYSYQKFDYITASSSANFVTNGNSSTAVDLNIYSQAWILWSGGAQSVWAGVSAYIRVNLATETPVNKGYIGDGTSTSRQLLNNAYAAFMVMGRGGAITSLSYATETISDQGGFAGMSQLWVGMPVTNSYGYVIGYNNVRVNLSGITVTSWASATGYTYNFGESHSLCNSVFGFLMAGYPDNSGRYSGVQHALCERITLATEAKTIMNDIQLPQSSGQMMQGF